MSESFALTAFSFLLLGILLGSLLRAHRSRRARLRMIARDIYVASSRLQDFRTSLLVIENILCIFGLEAAGRNAVLRLGEAKATLGQVELVLFELQRAFQNRTSAVLKLYDQTFRDGELFKEIQAPPAKRWSWEEQVATAIRSIGRDLNGAMKQLVRTAIDDEPIDIGPIPANLKH